MSETDRMYWLITAPKTREDTFATLDKKTSGELSNNWKMNIPELRVGTYESLMTLSDELVKVDAYVENITRKIANQLLDVVDAKDKADALTTPAGTIEQLLTNFRWDEAKYPVSQSLKQLTDLIHGQVGKLDEEIRSKISEYTTINHAVAASERTISGNLQTRDLSDIVKQEHMIDSEYMETLFVVVPKYSAKVFLGCYETLANFVVPKSAEEIDQDNDYILYRVVLFRKVAEDFKNAAREKKFIVREFRFDPNKSAKADKKKLDAEKDRIKKNLIRWCKTNFHEAYAGWLHIKAIRLFVESVMRYGLPTNFQAIVILPKKGKQKRLRAVLGEMFGYLGAKVFQGVKDDDPEADTYFPYVFFEANLELKNKTV